MAVADRPDPVDPARAAVVATWWPEADDDDLSLTVRVRSTWDEDRYRAMVASADALLDTLSAAIDGGRPDALAALDVPLESEVRVLVALMAHPGFRAENDLGLTRAAYDAYLDERSATLLALAARRREILARATAPPDDLDPGPARGPAGSPATSTDPVPSPEQEPR